jgi:L-malate glycosyltransferase
MKKHRVVMLGDNLSSHIQKWVHAIEKDPDIELHVFYFRDGVHFDGVHYHPLKPYFGNRLDYLLNVIPLRRNLKKMKPDVLHAHYATGYGILGALTRFSPFIVTGWGSDIFDSPKNFILKKFLKFTLKQADEITVLTEVTRKEISKYTSKPVHLIPFGVNISKFRENKKEKETIHIGTIRTLTEKYGVEYLIRAFAQVEKKYPNVILDIIGDGELMTYLKNLTVELGVSDKVIFHGYINQNDSFEVYIELLQNMDIFAILSILDSETFGVACVEASACAIPVVASNVGGLPEVIEDGKTGILVPPKNVEQTSRALEKLIIDKELRLEMGKNGRSKVENQYDWSKNSQEMIDLYKYWANHKHEK